MPDSDSSAYRAGYVGVVGLPNAGKSSLVNRLVREKVSIVTHKAQTTRQRIHGIYSDKICQLVFVDAPGIVNGEAGLNGFLRKEAEDVRENVDALLVVLNLDCKHEEKIQSTIDWALAAKKPLVFVVTKTDLGFENRRVLMLKKLRESGVEAETFFLSNTKSDWKDFKVLIQSLAGKVPESPEPLYSDELYTTQSIREICAETIREKCFKVLKQELPYKIAVKIVRFVDESVPKIYAEIIVDKDNQRLIVVGQGGAVLKRIGTMARQDIEKMLGKKVFLDIHVKARRNWERSKELMKELGYAHLP